MANQTISLTNFDPNLAAIQRQQKIAELLSQQAQAPIDINSGGGVQAPINPLAVLAKGLQGYGGSYLERKAQEKAADLQKGYRSEYADALKNFYQAPGAPAQPAVPAMPTTIDGTAPVIPGAEAPVQNNVAATIPAQAATDAVAPHPTSASDQMQMAAKMLGTNNPYLAQVAPGMFEAAQKRSLAAQSLAGLNLADVPDRVRPIIQALIAQGDSAGAVKAYEEATKPQVVGGALVAPKGNDFTTLVEAKDPSIKEYEFAKGQGFTGTLADWQKTKAQNTHITVDAGSHGWQVVNDAKGNPYRYNPNTGQATSLDGRTPITPDGYGKVSTNNPRTPVGIFMETWKKEHPNASSTDQQTAMNTFVGQQATARTLGGIEAKVGSASNGLDTMIQQSNQVYNRLGRGNFVPFNKLQQMANTGAFSDPLQADAYAADAGVINLWGKSINPSGVLTVEAQRRGEQMLSQAQSPEAHAAVLNRMLAESQASRGGISQSQHNIGINQPSTAAPAPSATDALLKKYGVH